jgi:elongation factor G
MDKVGADFEMTVESIRDKLLANPIILQLPIGAADSFSGIIDLIRMRAVFYQQEKLGATFKETDIPSEMVDTVKSYRMKMLELAAEYDDELMDAFVHDNPISIDLINRAIRKGTLKNELNPVFVGSALKYIGVQRLLDGIVEYLPSPLDRPALTGHKPGEKKKHNIEIKCDSKGSLVALAFKITSDIHGDLSFLRIYQGTLKSGSRVLNVNREKRENITRIFEMHASERKMLDFASAGDIVAVVGLKETLTGDTISDPKKPVSLPSISFPASVVSMSIEPRTAAERAKLADVLFSLKREDPTFGCKIDSETGQTIISGMGELHLEVLQHKIVREKGVNVRIGKPRVAYKEAITVKTEVEGKFQHQTGGHGQYGHVVLRMEPFLDEDGNLSNENEFESKVSGQSIPKEYIPSVARGVKDALGSGVLAGYPVVGVKVTLLDGSYHAVDSSDLAFEQAATKGVENGLKEACSVLLEPIMRLQAVVPEANFGAVQAGLLSKRGLITDCHVHGNMRVIDANVPLAEMFGYSSEIRSATAGRGTFTMEPLTYQKIPEQVAEQLI